MNFFEIVLTLAISLGAVVWGVNIYNQKGTWFLAGWNTMSKEEKATYNEKAICHLFGKCVVFCGIGAFLLLCGSFNHNDFVLCVGLGIIAIMVILSIIIPKINPKKYRQYKFQFIGQTRRESMELSIQERLKDLRVERGLTLEQLAEQTHLSKSALGSYEAEDFKDISHYAIIKLAKFYEVTVDYLLGRSQTKITQTPILQTCV